jgi:plasmid stability protein
MEAFQMAVNLSVKDVPDVLVDALRERARNNHRSLQGEMMAMIEAHVGGRPFRARELWEAARAAGLDGAGEAVQMVREDRDSR